MTVTVPCENVKDKGDFARKADSLLSLVLEETMTKEEINLSNNVGSPRNKSIIYHISLPWEFKSAIISPLKV